MISTHLSTFQPRKWDFAKHAQPQPEKVRAYKKKKVYYTLYYRSIGPSVGRTVRQSVANLIKIQADVALLLLPTRPRLGFCVHSLVLLFFWSYQFSFVKNLEEVVMPRKVFNKRTVWEWTVQHFSYTLLGAPTHLYIITGCVRWLSLLLLLLLREMISMRPLVGQLVGWLVTPLFQELYGAPYWPT